MKHKAVLFDLDGTLIDTLQDLADSVNTSLKYLGFPEHEVEAYKYFVGDGREMLATRALPRDKRDSASVNRLVELSNGEYSRRWNNSTVIYEGVPSLLSELTARDIKMAVLSNKPHDFTELIVSEILSQWSFEAVAGVSPDVAKKPDPEGALRIARQLGMQASEFLYLGDSDVDMKTATAAGMFPVGALWGFRTREELIDTGAKAVIEHPGGLLPLL